MHHKCFIHYIALQVHNNLYLCCTPPSRFLETLCFHGNLLTMQSPIDIFSFSPLLSPCHFISLLYYISFNVSMVTKLLTMKSPPPPPPILCVYTSCLQPFLISFFKSIVSLRLNGYDYICHLNSACLSFYFPGILAGCTNKGKVAMWKYMVSKSKTDAQSRWELQPVSVLEGEAELTQIQVRNYNNISVCISAS